MLSSKGSAYAHSPTSRRWKPPTLSGEEVTWLLPVGPEHLSTERQYSLQSVRPVGTRPRYSHGVWGFSDAISIYVYASVVIPVVPKTPCIRSAVIYVTTGEFHVLLAYLSLEYALTTLPMKLFKYMVLFPGLTPPVGL